MVCAPLQREKQQWWAPKHFHTRAKRGGLKCQGTAERPVNSRQREAQTPQTVPATLGDGCTPAYLSVAFITSGYRWEFGRGLTAGKEVKQAAGADINANRMRLLPYWLVQDPFSARAEACAALFQTHSGKQAPRNRRRGSSLSKHLCDRMRLVSAQRFAGVCPAQPHEHLQVVAKTRTARVTTCPLHARRQARRTLTRAAPLVAGSAPRAAATAFASVLMNAVPRSVAAMSDTAAAVCVHEAITCTAAW